MAAFEIVYTHEATEELKQLRRLDQVKILAAVMRHLLDRPEMESDSTIKKLDPPVLAGFRLRVGDYRVFYDVYLDDSRVQIVAIRYKGRQTLEEAAGGSNN